MMMAMMMMMKCVRLLLSMCLCCSGWVTVSGWNVKRHQPQGCYERNEVERSERGGPLQMKLLMRFNDTRTAFMSDSGEQIILQHLSISDVFVLSVDSAVYSTWLRCYRHTRRVSSRTHSGASTENPFVSQGFHLETIEFFKAFNNLWRTLSFNKGSLDENGS